MVSNEGMTIEELNKKHRLYDEFIEFWKFLLASYEGIRSLINNNFVLYKHERESIINYQRRVKEAYSLGFSASIADVFNFHLFRGHTTRDMGELKKDKQWGMFSTDCDLRETDFDKWMLETQLYSGILGHIGILVDKSPVKYTTVEQEIQNKVYPFVVRYFPQNILDWKYEKDENGRPCLAYIKLLDDDGVYVIWTREWWAKYVVREEDKTYATPAIKNVTTGEIMNEGDAVKSSGEEAKIAPISTGVNNLKEVPFVWFHNIKSKEWPIGISDIKDVVYIDGSIIRNLSGGEEIIHYAAFPMMRKPWPEQGVTNKAQADEAGVTSILGFDPDKPEAKPDWLKSEVAEPLEAILKWIERKINEVYRTTNVGGTVATEVQRQAKSGVALKTEFQLLNGKLVSKGRNAQNAEMSIKRLWCLWQNRMDVFSSIQTEWPKTYDVESLSQDLENILVSKAIVVSKKFNEMIQKKTARQVLPNASDQELFEMDKEIEQNASKPPVLVDEHGNVVVGTGNGPSAEEVAGSVLELPGNLVQGIANKMHGISGRKQSLVKNREQLP